MDDTVYVTTGQKPHQQGTVGFAAEIRTNKHLAAFEGPSWCADGNHEEASNLRAAARRSLRPLLLVLICRGHQILSQDTSRTKKFLRAALPI